MIDFNIPPSTGRELQYISEAIAGRKICGDGKFTHQCSQWMEQRFSIPKILLTTSCTHALEMAALLCNIQPGDEVILPSFTFVSTADAFVLRGAKLVYVDIRPDTLNIDETKIEAAITRRTKVIVPVHYAGVSCEMNTILDVARRYHLLVVEDAAQGVMSSYFGKSLGSMGDFGCFSFHETKNYSMGEGGALALRDLSHLERAEIIREKGTNRSKFFRGQVDKYTWIDAGSSYLPSELNAAYLWPQLQAADQINQNRLNSWEDYYHRLQPLAEQKRIELPSIPDGCKHNAHMFYIKTKDLKERTQLSRFLKERGIQAIFHYIPLHLSPAGKRYGFFHGQDEYTTRESERLLRLPLYYGLTSRDRIAVVQSIFAFYRENGGDV